MPLTSGRPQEYILVNSGDEPLPVTACGLTITIPPVDQTVPLKDGKPTGRYRFNSAVGRDGKRLPGTVAIRDQFEDRDGAHFRTFDALEWCSMVEQNHKVLFDNGYDQTMDPDQVPAIQERGRKLWDAALLKRDENIVRHAREQASYWKERGRPQPPSTQDEAVKAAIARLNKRRAEGRYGDTNPISVEELDAALGLSPKKVDPLASPAAVPAGVGSMSDLDMAAISLFEAIREHKLRLTNDEQAGLIERNPEVMAKVQAKVEAAEATPA